MEYKGIKLFLLMGLLILLSGCWAGEFDKNVVKSALEARKGNNLLQIQRLEDNNLIDKASADSFRKSLNELFENYSNKDPDSASISWYLKGKWFDWETKATNHKDFPYSESNENSGVYRDEQSIKPINAVLVNQAEGFNKLMERTVWVLKSTSEMSSSESAISLDIITKVVERAKATGDCRELITYFKNTNEPLLDTSNPDSKLIVPTKLKSETVECFLYDKKDKDKKNPKIIHTVTPVNELGYDLTLEQDGIPVVALRFNEFNPKAIDKILGQDGISKDKYLVDKDNKNIYLLEYPVSYVSSLTVDNGEYNSIFTQSDLRVNLLNGCVMDSRGNKLNVIDGGLLKVGGDETTNGVGQSSFVLYGDTNYKVGYKENLKSGGRIVLRDYLELYHMPYVVENEDMTVLGRMLRILNFKGKPSSEVGKFRDKNGNITGGDNCIYISDIMDITSGQNGKAYVLGPFETTSKQAFNTTGQAVNTTGQAVNTTGQAVNTTGQAVNTTGQAVNTEEDDGTAEAANSNSKLLETEFKDNINITTVFPGDIVGTMDKDVDVIGRPILYGIALNKSPFDTALYSTWINNKDIENGGLLWWNKWLKDNKFIYSIDINKLNQFFVGNYRFEMSKEGFIILDLMTIAKIQKEYNKKDAENQISWFRTLFIMLGLGLIAYAIVIIAAWAFDVTMLVDIKVLNIITFGKWEAIIDNSDIGKSGNNKFYMNFKDIIYKCSTFIGIGLLLTFVDIIYIISLCIEIFGGFAKLISWIIFGNKQ